MKDIWKEYIRRIDEFKREFPMKYLNFCPVSWKETYYPKKSYLLNIGEVCKYVFIIKSGIVWKFYTHDGKKIPTEFAFPNDLIFSFQSYATQKPSLEYIQTFEDSLVQKIEYGKFESIKMKSDILIELDTLLLEYQILKLEDRLHSLQFKTAKERLLWLENREPHLLDKIPRRHIASYLGITLETLIRLRKRV